MSGGEDLGEALGRTLGSLEHGELVDIDGLVFVNATLQVPAREVSAVGTGEGSGTKATDRGPLPEAVVNYVESGLLGPGVG
jgi:hypothetical protein